MNHHAKRASKPLKLFRIFRSPHQILLHTRKHGAKSEAILVAKPIMKNKIASQLISKFYHFLRKNNRKRLVTKNYPRATNEGIKIAMGEFIGLFDHDGLLKQRKDRF
jgi:hypothetical protein